MTVSIFLVYVCESVRRRFPEIGRCYYNDDDHVIPDASRGQKLLSIPALVCIALSASRIIQ